MNTTTEENKIPHKERPVCSHEKVEERTLGGYRYLRCDQCWEVISYEKIKNEPLIKEEKSVKEKPVKEPKPEKTKAEKPKAEKSTETKLPEPKPAPAPANDEGSYVIADINEGLDDDVVEFTLWLDYNDMTATGHKWVFKRKSDPEKVKKMLSQKDQYVGKVALTFHVKEVDKTGIPIKPELIKMAKI